MEQWHPWQWPIDDLSALQTKRFLQTRNGKTQEWESLHLPLGQIEYQGFRPIGKNEHFCKPSLRGGLQFYPARFGDSRQNSRWEQNFSQTMEYGLIAHSFFLNEAGNLRQHGEPPAYIAVISARGEGAWQRWNGGRIQDSLSAMLDDGAPFELSPFIEVDEFIQRPALDFWNELQQAQSNAQSDAFFAWKWLFLNNSEKENLLWNWSSAERESRAEAFKELMHCALLKSESLWEEDDHWMLSVMGDYYASGDADATLFKDDPDNACFIPDQLQSDLDSLWQRLAPLNRDVLTHKCACTSLQNSRSAFTIGATRPNQHELMEAYLHWQDWLSSTEPQI